MTVEKKMFVKELFTLRLGHILVYTQTTHNKCEKMNFMGNMKELCECWSENTRGGCAKILGVTCCCAVLVARHYLVKCVIVA